MSNPPKILDAPGYVLRPHKLGWEVRWQCRTDLVRRGFMPKSMKLWAGVEPSATEAAFISDNCRRLQDEMLLFGRGGLPEIVAFDGTLRTLINCYQTDPDSRYRKKRYSTRRNHDNMLRRIAKMHGHEEICDIKGRTLLAWHALWTDGGVKLANGQTLKGLLRVLFAFGF